jgi:hypothetical protein
MSTPNTSIFKVQSFSSPNNKKITNQQRRKEQIGAVGNKRIGVIGNGRPNSGSRGSHSEVSRIRKIGNMIVPIGDALQPQPRNRKKSKKDNSRNNGNRGNRGNSGNSGNRSNRVNNSNGNKRNNITKFRQNYLPNITRKYTKRGYMGNNNIENEINIYRPKTKKNLIINKNTRKTIKMPKFPKESKHFKEIREIIRESVKTPLNETRKNLTSHEWQDIHNRILDAPFYKNKKGKQLVLENWDYDSDSGNIILYYSGLKDFGHVYQNPTSRCFIDKKNREIKFKLSEREQRRLKNTLTEDEEAYERTLDEIARKYSIKCLNIMYPFKGNIPDIRKVIINNKLHITGLSRNYKHFKLTFEEIGKNIYNISISSLIDPTKSVEDSEYDLANFIIRILKKLERKNPGYLERYIQYCSNNAPLHHKLIEISGLNQ